MNYISKVCAMFYRVEVNPKNIGVVLETPFSLNPTRVGIAYNRAEWQLLSTLVDISLKNDISLSSICNAAVKQNPDIAYLLPGIWEVLFEKARPQKIPIRRTECAFFFANKADALNYKSSYPGMQIGTLCKVEIMNEIFSMKADMKWLDNINENVVKASEVIDEFGKYWAGEMTVNPTIEILFVGKYKLTPAP